MAKKKISRVKTCPYCGEDVAPDLSRCTKCRRNVEKSPDKDKKDKKIFLCPQCGALVDRNAKLCSKCHTELEGYDSPGEAEEERPKADDFLEHRDSVYICPECGAMISEDTTVCPKCGAELEASSGEEEVAAENVEAPKGKDALEDKASLFMCHSCGALISSGSTVCPKCNAPFEGTDEDALVKKEMSEVLGDDGLLEHPMSLYICPQCGALMSSAAKICPQCGAEDVESEESKETTEGEEAKAPSREEPPDRKASLFMCPACGAFISEDASVCPKCGAEVGGEEEVEEEPGELETEQKAEVADEKPSLYMCHNCGAFLSSSAEVCPICSATVVVEEEEEGPEGPVPPAIHEPEPTTHPESPTAEEVTGQDTAEVAQKVEAEPSAMPAENQSEKVEAEPSVMPAEEQTEKGALSFTEEELIIKGILAEADLKNCATCGAKIPVEATSCSSCGSLTAEAKVFEKIEEGTKGFNCPLCGASQEADSDSCQNCGTVFMEEKPDYAEEEIDRFFEQLKVVLERKPTPLTDLAKETEFEMPSEPAEPARQPVPEIAVRAAATESKAAPAAPQPIPVSVQQAPQVPSVPPAEPKVTEQAESGVIKRTVRILPRPERIFEYFMYSVLAALIVNLVGIMSGIPPIQYVVLALYGLLLLANLVLIASLRLEWNFWKDASTVLLGYFFLVLGPLGWFFAPPNALSLITIALGTTLAMLGFFLMKEKRLALGSIYICVLIGISILFLLILHGIRDPTGGLDEQGLAAVIIGIGFLAMGTATFGYRRADLHAPRPGARTDMYGEGGASFGYDSDIQWYSRASALIILDRYKEALEAVDVALTINPKSEVAWVIKGSALSRLNEQEEAIRCYNNAIGLNPVYEVAWNNKGNALARMKRYDDALKCYDEALKIVPNYREAWVNKGYVLTKIGKYKDAAYCAERVMTASPAGARAQ